MASLVSARRHLEFYVSAGSGVLVGLAALAVAPALAVIVGVDVFFAVYLGLVFRLVPALTADFLRKHAADENAPAPLILVVTALAVVASAISLFLLLAGEQQIMPVPLSLSVTSVVLGWFAIHTMWAMHYAYEYYDVPNEAGGAKKGSVEGGLDFPGDDRPDGVAFLYFSYVVGATAQTSDTSVTTNTMRRLVLFHGVFSFFFNTVLVAAAVNIVVSLGG